MNEYLCGRQPVFEALRARRRRVMRLLVLQSSRPCDILHRTLRLADERAIPVRQVEQRALTALVGGANHQGIAAECGTFPYADFAMMARGLADRKEPALLLVLDHVEDPQNLGALLRSADAAGVHGVILPRDRAVHVTPAVVRASAGASEHAQVALVTNLVHTLEELKDEGLRVAGLEGSPDATLYTAADLTGPIALVVGSEGFGLKRLVREACDLLVRLPMRGKTGSLNAGAAGAVALYEVLRQRQAI